MNSYEVTRVGPRPWHQFWRRSKTLQGPVGDRVSRPRPWLNELEFRDLTQHWLGFVTVSETDRHRAKRVKLLSAAVSALASVIVLLTRFSRLQITLPLHLMTGDQLLQKIATCPDLFSHAATRCTELEGVHSGRTELI